MEKMTDTQYKQLKTKYRKWKQFLFSEFDTYAATRHELQNEQNALLRAQKQVMVDMYESVSQVVLQLENLGIGLASSHIHE